MGGRGSASGKSNSGVNTISPSEFKEELINYTAGGYGSPTESMSGSAIGYMERHMSSTSSTLYRVEESRFTADKIEEGSTFSFNNNYRGFSESKSFIDEAIDEYGVGEDSPAVFVVQGFKKSFSVNKYYEEGMFASQKEHITGGKFKVNKKENKDGRIYVYITQIDTK